MNNMTTPIADFVKKYAHSDVSRFHMPGHKGVSFLGCEKLDITEISGADVLGSANGIIAQSEESASLLFGSRHSFYSTEGSTLVIKTMLALIKKSAAVNQRVKILAARNAHKAFIYACALLDLDVEWIYSETPTHICACHVSAEQVEKELKDAEALPAALYITTPDYLGNIADVSGIADVCHKYGVPLLVDNAHGAYLAFTQPSLHPLALGADMCCDSAHKTLPVLTGGAYLHVSKRFERFSTEQIRGVMSIFASTSPSYLILQSLDICNRYLADGYIQRLAHFIGRVKELKSELCALGFPPESTEELKLVLSKPSCAYSGNELSRMLSALGIEVEFADEDTLVLMLTPELTENDLLRLVSAFKTLPRRTPSKTTCTLKVVRPTPALTIREAMFAPSETVYVKASLGRICAIPTVSCPPAIPIVVGGEIIDKNAIELFDYYGIEKIDVVK